MKQKQKQTQKTNINISIGDTITKKKRGRPTKREQTIKKPIQQPIAPVIQSFNQPTFKQATPPASSVAGMQPQPSLATSILASQEKPNIMAKEIKQETAIQKALVEQNTQTEEAIPKVNELEKVKKERIKKLEQPIVKPIEGAFKMTPYEENKSLRVSLLSQHLADVGDDTEEINSLRTVGLFSSSPIITNPLSGLKIPKIPNPLSGVKIPNIPNPLSGVSSSGITNYLDSFLDEEETQPIEEVVPSEENISPLTNISSSSPTPLSQPVITQTLQDKLDEIQDEQPIEETKEETMLQETKDEEPIIEKSGEAQANEAISMIQKILKPIETPPTILQPIQKEAPLLNEEEDQITNPQEQAEETTPMIEIKQVDEDPESEYSKYPPKEQAQRRYKELVAQGLLKGSIYQANGIDKNKATLEEEIRTVDAFWVPKPTGKVAGAKAKPKPEPILEEEVLKKKRGRPKKED